MREQKNNIYQNAILTPVTQIGELVKRLSNEFKQKYKEIPWRNIAGMRDIVVHNYETIDKLILWNVADGFKIVEVKFALEEVLKKEVDIVTTGSIKGSLLEDEEWEEVLVYSSEEN